MDTDYLCAQNYFRHMCHVSCDEVTFSTVMRDVNMASKMCPTVEELECSSLEQNNWTCPEINCGCIFTSMNTYKFHQIKVHNIQPMMDVRKSDKGKTEYHCPIQTCIYRLNQKKHFKTLAHLRQHYLKVHKEKTHCCSSCSKKYATSTLLNLHQTECGSLFKCATCDNVYSMKTSLQTHCRRHKHLFQLTSENVAKSKQFKADVTKTKKISKSCSTNSISESSKGISSPLMPKPDAMLICFDNKQVDKSPTVILMGGMEPKTSIPKKYVGIKPKEDAEADILTYAGTSKSAHSCSLCENAKQTIETQTENVSLKVKPVINMQDSAVQAKPRKRNMVAQTTGDYILKTAMQQADLPLCKTKQNSRSSKRKGATQCSETQTAPVEKKRKMHNVCDHDVVPSQRQLSSALTSNPGGIDIVDDIQVEDLQELLDEFNRSNNQTQTTTQWEEIQSCMAENNSTQTAESYLAASLNCPVQNSSSIETQTAMSIKPGAKQAQNPVPFSLPSVETFLHDTQAETSYYREVMLSDSATEVPPMGHEITIHNTYSTIETQTVFPDFRNVNMETQTLSADIVDEFLNHMETQTNEDFVAELGLSDMETQTTLNWGPDDDMDFTNVETQTSLHAHSSVMENPQSTDMQTQTWFPSLESYITEHSDCHTQTTLNDLEQLLTDLAKN